MTVKGTQEIQEFCKYLNECLATFLPLMESSERIFTCGLNIPVQTHMKNLEDLLELMSASRINRPKQRGKYISSKPFTVLVLFFSRQKLKLQ